LENCDSVAGGVGAPAFGLVFVRLSVVITCTRPRSQGLLFAWFFASLQIRNDIARITVFLGLLGSGRIIFPKALPLGGHWNSIAESGDQGG